MDQRIFYIITCIMLLRVVRLGFGSTTTPCNGNWTTVACGIGTKEDSECDVGIFIVEVTVAQLAPSATCELLEEEEDIIFKRRSVVSGTYKIFQSNSILVTGTCIGIFNVCTGVDDDSCCDPIPTTTTSTITSIQTTNHSSVNPATTTATITTLLTTTHASTGQCQDSKSDGVNVGTAIIVGSTVGGSLSLASVLTAAYMMFRRVPCTSSRIMANTDASIKEENNKGNRRSGRETADVIMD